MVLLTVAYFEAKWLHQFELRDTRSLVFHVDASTEVQIDMMSQTDDFLYLVDDTFEVLGMPYESSRIAMFVFLPKVQHGLTHAMASLTGSTFFGRIRSCEKTRLKVILPKFKFEASVEVRSLLQNLGVKNAFKPGIADFTGMLRPEPQIHVGSVVQKVYVEVGEHGTTAAATGIMAFPPSGIPQRTSVFNADHPFMYAIVEDNGLVLFAGFFLG